MKRKGYHKVVETTEVVGYVQERRDMGKLVGEVGLSVGIGVAGALLSGPVGLGVAVVGAASAVERIRNSRPAAPTPVSKVVLKQVPMTAEEVKKARSEAAKRGAMVRKAKAAEKAKYEASKAITKAKRSAAGKKAAATRKARAKANAAHTLRKAAMV